MRLLLIGPPGSGKGTQAVKLAARVGIPAISTGDIFRANVAGETELGRKAKSYMDSGAYVPDDLTNELVLDRLGQPDVADGFLLDGFPRTLTQVGTLDTFLQEHEATLDAVVQLSAAKHEVVERLLKRAADQGRSDDTESVIVKRLDVYDEQTSPLVQVYADRGLLRTVNAVGAVDEVTNRIYDVLALQDPAL